VGSYRIVKRVGFDYRIVSKGRKEMVVHHDQLKHSYIPVQESELVCPSREVGEFKVVDVTPSQDSPDGNARVRSARLRQHINQPMRYGFSSKHALGTRT
jgi:hypothetical protein